jgi:uncharacterized protein YdhG (YjbR/CyaY superfamily)
MTVDEYLAGLPEERRVALERVREVVNARLPQGYEEGIQYGMLSWYVPLARFPKTYNQQPLAIAALGSQKSYMALYLMGVYGDPEADAAFRAAYKASGKKLDMGKSCVRFPTLDALPLELIGETIAKIGVEKLIAQHEAVHSKPKPAPAPANVKPAAAKKAPTAKKPVAKANAKPVAKANAKPAAKPEAKAKPKKKAR